MKVKAKIFSLILLISLLTSCVPRRFDQLMARRGQFTYQREGLVLTDGKFHPDEIEEFSVDEYLKWYEGLKSPLKLELPDPKKPKELTKDEMIEDFEFLFKELKENYPFFEVLKRRHKIDFVKSHDKYLTMVKKAKTDEEFIETLKMIIGDLKSDHAKIADKAYVKETLEYFAQNFKSPSIYYEFLNLNRSVVRNRYDLKGKQSDEDNIDLNRRRDIFETADPNNLSFEDLGKGLGLIKIKEMAGVSKYSEDLKVLKDFLKNKHLYKALIIDIRGNSGGNEDYWQSFLLPKLLTSPKKVTNSLFFKDSDKTKLIFADENLNAERLENMDTSALNISNTKDIEGFDLYMKDIISISPDKSDRDYGFDGEIFILVDKEVYSAAEGFTNFMKNSNAAILLGEQTKGDGITLGIINSVLPNSGLVFTYTNTLGFDSEGKLNEENPTKPDIETNSYKDSIRTIQEMIR